MNIHPPPPQRVKDILDARGSIVYTETSQVLRETHHTGFATRFTASEYGGGDRFLSRKAATQRIEIGKTGLPCSVEVRQKMAPDFMEGG